MIQGEVKRNVLLCGAWICSALIIGSLLWLFTQSYRTRLLTETVNKSLALHGSSERIENVSGFSGVSVTGGQWFLVSGSSDRAFVFTILHNGIAAACVALTGSNGRVKTIIPLGSNSRQIIEGLPPPVYRFYTNRIEKDAQTRGFNRELNR